MVDPILLSDRLFESLTGSDVPAGNDDIAGVRDELSPELKAFVDDLHNPDYVDSQIGQMGRFDVDAAWRMVSGQAGGNIAPARRTRRPLLRGWFRWMSVAAVVAILAGVAMYMRDSHNATIPPVISEEIARAIELSGERGLTAAVIEKKSYPVRSAVPAAASGSKAQAETSSPAGADSEDEVVAEMLSATKVTTYHDKEFWLTLPDGTLVHLGANTRIIYPDRFAGDSRDVYLEGEAYFIVAKNKASRFVVHTKVATTTVYGTEFDVITSDDDALCRVVLVRGSVGVATLSGCELELSPGQEARMTDESITVSDVDVTPYEAWNTGRIDFTDWPLGKVMSVIGKWYGHSVRFDDESLSQIRISGSFNRYETLGPTLDAISTITGLDIGRDSDRITIRQHIR